METLLKWMIWGYHYFWDSSRICAKIAWVVEEQLGRFGHPTSCGSIFLLKFLLVPLASLIDRVNILLRIFQELNFQGRRFRPIYIVLCGISSLNCIARILPRHLAKVSGINMKKIDAQLLSLIFPWACQVTILGRDILKRRILINAKHLFRDVVLFKPFPSMSGVSRHGPKRVALPSHGNCPEIVAYVPGDDEGNIFLELKSWKEALFPRSRCPDQQ